MVYNMKTNNRLNGVIIIKKILIIEDDISIHYIIEELLKKENYITYNAYSGTEALMLLEKDKYDLILFPFVAIKTDKRIKILTSMNHLFCIFF